MMLTVVALIAAVLCACGSTETRNIYHVHFETGAFRVADSLTIEPGQGGDQTDSSGNAATTSGGTELSPGNTVWIRGTADQGNIICIGTATTPTTETTAQTDANLEASVPLK